MRQVRRRGEHVRSAVLAFGLTALLGVWSGVALAQGDAPAGDLVAEPIEVEGFIERAPASVMVSLHGGLPAYRSVGVGVALKADQFGVALRGAWGSVGPAFGAQARWYPPLPAPLPLYLGLGVDVYDGGVTPHGVVGAHVPLGPNWRFDLEGGAARASLGTEVVWTPHLSLGVGYAFAVDLPDPSAAADPDRTPLTSRAGASPCVPGDPDPDRLASDVDAAVRAFVRDGVALYGNAYRDLRYRYAIVRERIDGGEATVQIRYDGSARAISGGQRVEASGTASASFRWTGCRWQQTSLSY